MACSAIPGNYPEGCPTNLGRVLSFDACSSVEPKPLPFKAISIKQPFAGMIAYGYKTLEIRTWSTNYRGRLLICASKTVYPGNVFTGGSPATIPAKDLVTKIGFWPVPIEAFRPGFAVCTVELVNVRPMVKEDELAARHPFIKGAFVWELKHPQRIEPVEVNGKLGLFEVQLRQIEFIAD